MGLSPFDSNIGCGLKNLDNNCRVVCNVQVGGGNSVSESFRSLSGNK